MARDGTRTERTIVVRDPRDGEVHVLYGPYGEEIFIRFYTRRNHRKQIRVSIDAPHDFIAVRHDADEVHREAV